MQPAEITHPHASLMRLRGQIRGAMTIRKTLLNQ
jgi:hypothetical protein